MILDVGRVCMKIAGREAGKYCIIIGRDKEFVLVSGPKSITRIKRRKCNITHLEPTEHLFQLSSTEDGDLEAQWKKSGLIEKLEIKIPQRRKTEKTKSEKPVKQRKVKKKEVSKKDVKKKTKEAKK